jgi:2-oxoglutarate ferredoxin oxidoreductase subunit alpha
LGAYTETPDEYQEVMDRLARKHSAAAAYVPDPVIERRGTARMGVVTVGGCDPAVREALTVLEERGIAADYMRVRGFPFDKPIRDFLEDHDICFVVEQNRDAQLRALLILEAGGSPNRLRSILAYGGYPLSAQHVVDGVTSYLSGVRRKPAAVRAKDTVE